MEDYMKRIGVIGAMEPEIRKLQESMQDVHIVHKASTEFYEGTLDGHPVVAARSGIGKVNAAVCAQIMIDLFQVDVLLNTGIAGSLDPQINIGDIVLSTDLVHHDMNAVGFGYARGQIPQMEAFSFAADPALIELAEQVCRRVNPEIQVFRGRILSGDQFISDQAVKDDIKKTFGGLAVEMEGASIAQTAFINGVPFLGIRAISDKADGSAVMDYPAFEAKAAMHSSNLTMGLIGQL